MKKISYQFMTEVNCGTEEPNIVQTFNQKEIKCADSVFEANYAIAQREAYNGEYTIEDIPDEPAEPTQLDRIEAQTMFTALMTDTLLEEV